MCILNIFKIRYCNYLYKKFHNITHLTRWINLINSLAVLIQTVMISHLDDGVVPKNGFLLSASVYKGENWKWRSHLASCLFSIYRQFPWCYMISSVLWCSSSLLSTCSVDYSWSQILHIYSVFIVAGLSSYIELRAWSKCLFTIRSFTNCNNYKLFNLNCSHKYSLSLYLMIQIFSIIPFTLKCSNWMFFTKFKYYGGTSRVRLLALMVRERLTQCSWHKL